MKVEKCIKLCDYHISLKLHLEIIEALSKRVMFESCSLNKKDFYFESHYSMCDKFMNTHENSFDPIITDQKFIREIPPNCKIIYNRQKQEACILLNEDVSDMNEIADGILQIIYFMMVDFDKNPFHAACVGIKSKAYLIMGHSGAGKTTLLASLLALGCDFVADDVTFIDSYNSIYPGCEYKISCSHFTKEKIQDFLYPEIHPNAFLLIGEKWLCDPSVFLNTNLVRQKINLEGIVFPKLKASDTSLPKVVCREMDRKESFIHIAQHTLSNSLSNQLKKLYFKSSVLLAQTVKSYSLEINKGNLNFIESGEVLLDILRRCEYDCST